jgi:Holliday junction resolvasome RuvABC endonuclease subunit
VKISARKRPGLISLGLDISATSTGLTVLRSADPKCKAPEVLFEDAFQPKTKGMERCHQVADWVIGRVVDLGPDRITIEGYALGKFAGAAIAIVSVGAIVRYTLYRRLEPSPTELKKFVTGKGGAKKEHMMMEVLSRWGHKSKNNDTADAYGLAALGLAWSGRLDMTHDMREIVGKQRLS